MKIGIMSMQRIYNYGSFLQAYALKKMIESINKNNSVFFVDYAPGKPLVMSNTKISTGIARKFRKIREYFNFHTSLINNIRFFNFKRTYAKRFFPMLGITKNIIRPVGFDMLVIGSDEVFNCVQSNINVGYARELFGHGIHVPTLISYAGSFGNTTFEKIRKYQIKDDLVEDLKKFDAISVRDENSFSIMSKLGIKLSEINIDPVLAYDYMKMEELIPIHRMFKEKFIIVYGYSGRFSVLENKCIKSFADNNKFKILCFGGIQDCCDKYINCSPFELLAYFRDAEMIITDTFHGTIFSIINEKKFITVIRKSKGGSYGNEEKITFLLHQFGLDSEQTFHLSKSILQQHLNKKIDYRNVEKILMAKRNDSEKYLKKFISGEI